MQTFENAVTIQRPAAQVFAYLANFENIPAWNYAIEKTSKSSPGPARVGTTYRQLRSVPRRSEEGFQVTVFEPVTRLAVEGQIGPFHAGTSYVLEAIAGATRLTNNVALEPSHVVLRPIALLAVPKVKAAVAQNLAKLKQILEADGPA
jgi:hypothetical protein